MANATSRVKKGSVRWTDEFIQRSSATLASETTFYTQAMIGLTTGGYLAKFDDTQSLIFVGLVRGKEGNPVLPAGTAGDGTIQLDIHQPKRFELDVSAVAVTDIGKTVYASYDQTGVLAFGSTTYGNLIGVIVDVVASGIALVEPAYDGTAGNRRLGACRRMAATGAQTISRWDMGKTIFIANTATLTLSLPAIATVSPGEQIVFVKDHASDTNALTLDPDGSEVIDASSTVATMDAPYDNIRLVANSSKWINLDGVA